MKFAFPISKTERLEDGRLLIEGVATSEALDLQGEILDYEGSKRAFEKWAGNIREAHDPKKPVGKAIEVIPDDTAKTLSVRAFISAGAKDTQAKVEDGTLSMFSVGGGVPTKTKMEKVGSKPVRRVLEWPMTELSLVDVGANPDACVSVAKAVGMEKEEEEEEPKPNGEEPPPKEDEPKEEPEPEPKVEAPKLSEADMTELVTKVTDAVLAALEAKAKSKLEEPPPEPKPEEKAAPAPEVTKDATAVYDTRTALEAIGAGLMAFGIADALLQTETAEKESGRKEPPKQLAALRRAMDGYQAGNAAMAEFIGSEITEISAPAPAMSTGPMEMMARAFVATGLAKSDQPTIDLDALAEKIAERLPLQKSAPTPDPRIEEIVAGIGSLQANVTSEFSKTASDLKAAFSGEVKALREGEVATLAKGMKQVLEMPVPGRSPLRNMTAAAQLIEKSAPTATNKANVLRSAAQGAPPSVRDYLLNEAAAVERS